MTVRIIASCVAESLEELRAQCRAVADLADLVEIRADFLPGVDPAALRRATDRPAVLTCRRTRDGGGFGGKEKDRIALFRRGIAAGFEYLDLEWRSEALNQCRGDAAKTRIICSHHDFGEAPTKWEKTLGQLAETGADLVKFVYTAQDLEDSFTARDMLTWFRRRFPDRPLLCFAMGEYGVPSRLLTGAWGGWGTYGCVGPPPAEGQVPVAELAGHYDLHTLTAKTRITGIVGDPVRHSLSPAMHNALYQELELDYRFLPLPSQTAAGAFTPAERQDIRLEGFSVTVPHKVAVLAQLDHVEPAATDLGAVNTVRLRYDQPIPFTDWEWGFGKEGNRPRLDGYNTDWIGARESLRPLGDPAADRPLAGWTACVLGAGGAARAGLYALRALGAEITVANRTRARGEAVARDFACPFLPLAEVRPGAFDLLVNATPCGMTPEEASCALAPEQFGGRAAFDMVYTPRETPFLRHAAAAGMRTVDGVAMLVHQGAAQFALLTGVEVDPARLAAAVAPSLEPATDVSF